MARYQRFDRKYGESATLDFSLISADGTGLETAASFAAGDLVIMKDEGAETNTSNLPTDEGTGYSLVLTATEMQAARSTVYIVDQTATKVWRDAFLITESYGNASAQHAFDLDTATQDVNITQITGTAQRATDLAEISQFLFANSATLTTVLDDDSVAGQKLAKALVSNFSRTTDSQEGVADNIISSASIVAEVWDAFLAAHQTSGSAGRLMSRSPDNIWDDIMETAAALGRRTGRQWMRLFAAALLQETARIGDWSALAMSGTKTRLSGTLNDDGDRTSVDIIDGD